MSGAGSFVALFMSLTLLLVGMSCLFWPQAIQSYSLKRNTTWLVGRNPFLDWMKTPQYLKYLRIMGGVILSLAAFLTIIFARKWFDSWFI
jgi:nitric oxide reductase large subunit